MFEFNVPSIWVANMDDTARVLTNLEAWAKKDKHTSLKSRPGAGKSSWGTTSQKHLAQHILQGFPGVGGELAGRIVDKFERVPLAFTVGIDEMMTVDGVGKKKAENMYHALDTISDG
jgi:ERCC4-type nuclease